jgi:hypothetical protein
VHYINDGTIDTGAIVAVTRTPVDRTRLLFWHFGQVYGAGIEALGNAAQRMLRGERLETSCFLLLREGRGSAGDRLSPLVY